MRIEDLPLKCTREVVTVRPDDSVTKAVQCLNKFNIGALPVCDADGALVGILSERDIIRGMSAANGDLGQAKVADLMTSNVVTCATEDNVNDIMEVMEKRSIRHVPVMTGDRLTAIVSSRDILSALLKETKSRVTTMTMAYELVR